MEFGSTGGDGPAVCPLPLGLFLPYPLFPHHMEHAGFSVYSDGEISEDFELVLEDARLRVEGMELYRGEATYRIFVCRSQPLFGAINKLAGKRRAARPW